MNLDNLSHIKLSELREKYKEKCKNSENKEEMKEIDRQISNSSLGTEHFFREMGQIYEASLSLPQTDPARQQLQHLPKLCAELLLDGFPLELVDGDASNIPLRWVSDVLSQLSDLVSPNRKILVVTVLGVQSTGKSTLLNTMFGVQFAVSSGRCTRAHEKNSRDRKLLLEQLNETTQAAAKMEKKEENKSFTDVMEYSPDTGNWYIPGLWNGNPPMAPVNAGYSEAVYELKKNIIQLLGNFPSCCMKTTSFHISSELVPQHLDAPAGELESYIMTSCKTQLARLLEDLGLEQYYRKKIQLRKILEIDEKTLIDEPGNQKSDLPWYFLRKLVMVNVTARNVTCTSVCNSCSDNTSGNAKLSFENLFNSTNTDDKVNPLDIITALFMCSDGFLQQEMALKMSMCRFSVPLLLPNCDTNQCKLMLWAMRDIVKKYRPQSLSESKGFIEDRIVLSELPMISLSDWINEDMKKVLNCDFMVIIDTEGLKSPELAQLDDSYEHDNELATLVVGLSDVTIVNVAMENSTEMKDILQIVVHAFLRMKEVGKKPRCVFVQQNVSNVSAHEKNSRDRKLLLEQLNETTQAAAKMEKKEENKSFTDVMEYSPDTGNWYIPGLWNGNPPMAPVNAGYSEAVYELKKHIIQLLGNCDVEL
ncbi:unnamed protein product [Oreochromis niloticus]|nr:unnamed protein product [Mustela putorius furo]